MTGKEGDWERAPQIGVFLTEYKNFCPKRVFFGHRSVVLGSGKGVIGWLFSPTPSVIHSNTLKIDYVGVGCTLITQAQYNTPM